MPAGERRPDSAACRTRQPLAGLDARCARRLRLGPVVSAGGPGGIIGASRERASVSGRRGAVRHRTTAGRRAGEARSPSHGRRRPGAGRRRPILPVSEHHPVAVGDHVGVDPAGSRIDLGRHPVEDAFLDPDMVTDLPVLLRQLPVGLERPVETRPGLRPRHVRMAELRGHGGQPGPERLRPNVSTGSLRFSPPVSAAAAAAEAPVEAAMGGVAVAGHALAVVAIRPDCATEAFASARRSLRPRLSPKRRSKPR